MNSQEINYLLRTFKTPFYLFDINVLKNRILYLRDKLPKKINLCYAIKANSFILKDMEPFVDRFEVCSFGEYHTCEESLVSSEKIVLSGVYKEEKDIRYLLERNIPIKIYTIESWEQYTLLKKLTKEFNTNIKVLLRLSSGNQFGMDKNVIHDIFKDKCENLEILGLQFFSTTQKKSIKRITKELDLVISFYKELEDTYKIKLKEIEFGPGLAVSYFQDDVYDEESYLDEFADILNNISDDIEITLEIGRGIAFTSGAYFTKVVDLKTNKNENYAIVDGGINHLVYYGGSLALRIPQMKIFQNNRLITGEEKNWNICGSLCTINDILVKQLPIKDLQLGDTFIFMNTGAYSVTEGISLFLSRNLPAVIKKNLDGEYVLIRNNMPTFPCNTPNLERS